MNKHKRIKKYLRTKIFNCSDNELNIILLSNFSIDNPTVENIIKNKDLSKIIARFLYG